MKQYIDKDTIKQKVQEKMLKACKRLYHAEMAMNEPYPPQSWIDEEKKEWEDFFGHTKITN